MDHGKDPESWVWHKDTSMKLPVYKPPAARIMLEKGEEDTSWDREESETQGGDAFEEA